MCKCNSKLVSYTEKLEKQSKELACAIGDSDQEFIQQIVENDWDISDKAFSTSSELQIFIEDMGNVKEENCSDTDVKNVLEHQIQMQTECLKQLQEANEAQMKIQKEFLINQNKQKNSVNLPKIEIKSFDGNRLNWSAFWDSFESAVHKNDQLSPVNKFNYLIGKLTGEAKRAVEGLSLSNKNYDIALRILHERFGNRQEIVNLHYKGMLYLATPKNSTDALRSFLDKVERHLRSLEVLGENTDQQVFVSMIWNKLPSEVLLQLELMKDIDSKWTTTSLRDLLRRHVTSKERSEKSKNVNTVGENAANSLKSVNAASRYTSSSNNSGTFVAGERNSTSVQPTQKCRYCDESHWSDQCSKYSTIDERKHQLKGSCYKCLRVGHMANECKTSKTCVYCGKTSAHHRSLCGSKFPRNSNKESAHFSEEIEHDKNDEVFDEESGLLSYNENVMMQTALTEVKSPDSDKQDNVCLLMDSGSHRTYITQSLANRLGLKVKDEQTINVVTFGSDKSKPVQTKSTTVKVKLKNGSYMTMTVNIVPTISGVIQRSPMKLSQYQKVKKMSKDMVLADTLPRESESLSMEFLIGNDYYLNIVESQKVEVSPGLFLLSTKFGWILSGRVQTNGTDTISCGPNMFIMANHNSVNDRSVLTNVDTVIPTKPSLEDFWNVESLGITDKPESIDDVKAITKFKETLKRDGGRYQVTWPWKDNAVELPENRGLADYIH